MITKNSFICDTGVLSRYCTNVPPYTELIDDQFQIDNLVINPLIKIELNNWLSGYDGLGKRERALTTTLIKTIEIIHFNESISKLATQIADKHIHSKPVDTFIIATALYYELPILTINKKDFKSFGIILL